MAEPSTTNRDNTGNLILSPIEKDELRAVRVLRFLSLGALYFLVAIGVKSLLSGHILHGTVLFMYGIAVSANLLIFRSKKNRVAFQNVFIYIVGTLFLFLTATGGESNTGPLWFYVFPPLGFYIFGLKQGLALSVVSIFAVFIIFYFPELPFVTTEYNPDFKIRFLSTLSFVTACAYILDDSRRTARDELYEMATRYELAARTDELTGLSNRRDMTERLTEELYRHQRQNNYFSVILMDIDHFKRVNDTFGHDAGDAVLKGFASLLKQHSRKIDTVSRWGGEEFLMLLPGTSLVQALGMAERLRSAVEIHTFSHGGKEIPISMSAGVCSIMQHENIDSLLKQADICLYEAKSQGRNRISPAVKAAPITGGPAHH